MTTIIREETRMDNLPKTYLQMYEEYIKGYKQYKQERVTLSVKTVEKQPVQ